jgi:hypothetical protein
MPPTLDDLYKWQASIQNALGGGVRSVETPQLGRVEFPNTDQLLTALGYVNAQIAALTNPNGNQRMLTVVAYRGLWPQGVEGSGWPCGRGWWG